MNRRWLSLAGLMIIFAAALWSAWSMLDRYFLGDDFAYIGRFAAMPLSEWPRLFINEWSGGIWGVELRELRPFVALTLWVDAHLWGTQPMGYHFTNLFLETLCGWLVAAIGWRLRPDRPWLGIIAGCLFVLHPVHAETVGWITGRVDVLAAAAYLTVFWAALRWLDNPRLCWAVVSWTAYFVGCFSKEFVLMAPLMVVLFAVFFRERLGLSWGRRLGILMLGFIGVFLIYFFCRQAAFHGEVGSGQSMNPLRAEYLQRQVSYLSWLVYPLLKTSQHHHLQWLPWSGTILAGVATLVCAVLIVWWQRSKPALAVWRSAVFFGVVWYLFTTLPLAVAGYFSPRHLYLTTAGFCLCVVLVGDALVKMRVFKVLLTVGGVLWSASVFSDAIRPWRASAKVSERMAVALRDESAAQDGTLWLIDAPPTYLGAWCWSWALPAALQPPFQPVRAVTWLEHPDAYVAPHLWRDRCAGVLDTASKRAVLFTVTARGLVERREINTEVLGTALTRLREELGKKPDAEVWRNFVKRLEAGGVAGGTGVY